MKEDQQMHTDVRELCLFVSQPCARGISMPSGSTNVDL